MSDWRLIRLNFGQNPVHFGELGIGMEEANERIRSDTLFSAWVSSYARLLGKSAVEHLLQQFPISPVDSTHGSVQPPFRLSSTFIFQRQGDRILDYLPRPLELPKGYPIDDDLTVAKTFKGLKYLPLEVWQRWYQGSGFDAQDQTELEAKAKNSPDPTGRLHRAGTFCYSEAFQGNDQPIPKIAVDRTTRATNLYHTGFVQYRWQPDSSTPQQVTSLAGLYFLLHIPPETPQRYSLMADLQAALHLLGEEGIGGERSSGAGRFEVEWLDLPPQWQSVVEFKGANHCSLVSLFWENPLPDTLLAETARYALQERGGWISSPFSGRQLRRQAVQMFVEGSVFPAQPAGQLADVTPSGFTTHTIYRNGIAVSLPVNL